MIMLGIIGVLSKLQFSSQSSPTKSFTLPNAVLSITHWPLPLPPPLPNHLANIPRVITQFTVTT